MRAGDGGRIRGFLAGAWIAALAVLLVAGTAAADGTRVSVNAPSGAPPTTTIVVNATGPTNVTLTIPPGARIDALVVDNRLDLAWQFSDAQSVPVPLAAGSHEIVLHASLDGDGPWSLGSSVPPLVVSAPGLDVTRHGAIATVAHPAPGAPVLEAAALAGVVSLIAAVALASRDRRALERERAADALARPTDRAPSRAPVGKEPGKRSSEMGLLDHLRELQVRARTALFVVALLFLFFSGVGGTVAPLGRFPLLSFYLGEPTFASEAYRAMATQLIPAGVTVVLLRPMDAVVAELGVGALLAVVTAIPVLTYEVAAFVGPALMPHERRFAQMLSIPIAALFILGALFAWFVLIPTIFRALYGFAPSVQATPLLAAPDLVSFAASFILILGIVFELPVAMATLSYAGLVKPGTFASKWRHSVVAIFIVAAIVTPDPTVVSQLLVALPMCALYFLGLAAAFLAAPRGERRRQEKAASARLEAGQIP